MQMTQFEGICKAIFKRFGILSLFKISRIRVRKNCTYWERDVLALEANLSKELNRTYVAENTSR